MVSIASLYNVITHPHFLVREKIRLAEGVMWVRGKIWISDEVGLTVSLVILLVVTQQQHQVLGGVLFEVKGSPGIG